MISLVWTKSNKIGSKAIMWASNADCSHFGFVLDSRLVFQSTFSKGVHLAWLPNFLQINTVVHRIDLNIDQAAEERIYLKLIEADDRPYDWTALIYLAYRFLLHKVVLEPLPTKNKLGSTRADMCIELARALEAIGVVVPSLDTATPQSLYLYLKDKLI